MRQVVERAIDRGWSITWLNNQAKLTLHTDEGEARGQPVFIKLTNNRPRAHKNVEALLRRTETEEQPQPEEPTAETTMDKNSKATTINAQSPLAMLKLGMRVARFATDPKQAQQVIELLRLCESTGLGAGDVADLIEEGATS